MINAPFDHHSMIVQRRPASCSHQAFPANRNGYLFGRLKNTNIFIMAWSKRPTTIAERFDRNLTLRFSKLRTFFSNKLKTLLVRSLFSICAVICMEDCDEALGIISSLVRVTSRLCSVPCAPSLVPWRHPLYSQGVRPLR